MGNKTTGRNWTRRSIEEIFDDMFAKKGGGSQPIPTGMGEFYGIVPRGQLYTGNQASGWTGLGYFYRGFVLSHSSETIQNHAIYQTAPLDSIRYMFFRVSSGVSPLNLIPGLHWAGFSFGDCQIVCAPTSDGSSQDVYQITYQNNKIISIPYNNNITYSYGPTETGETLTVSGGRFSTGSANFLDQDILPNCPLYGGSYDVFLIDFDGTSTPASDSDLLAIINTIHKSYSQYGLTHFNNVITI